MDSPAPDITLRAGRPEDAPAVAEIWRVGWHDGHSGFVPDQLIEARTDESFRTRAAQRVGDTTVAVVDGEVAGFVMVVEDEVEQVYVDGRHRGLGVANVLLAHAERQVKDDGHPVAWLAVVAGNARARRFYERNGWSDTGPFVHEAPHPDGPIPVPAHRYIKAV